MEKYPAWLPQCEPTAREEVTTILSEVSENGVIRGRVMHDSPTYTLSLSHNAITLSEFQQWEAWWKAHSSDEVVVTWTPDNTAYKGIFSDSPQVQYQPYQRFNVTTTLLVKKAPTTAEIAAPGTPGYFIPLAPNTLADLQALGTLGNTAAWASNQYVVLGDASEAYWDGTDWAAGRAP